MPLDEAEQSAVRATGGEVWLMIADDEGHGFAKPGNRDLYMQYMALFFEQRLLP